MIKRIRAQRFGESRADLRAADRMKAIAMRLNRFLSSRVYLVVAASCLSAAPAIAAEQKSPAPSAVQCQGRDMLSELAARAPTLHRQVIEDGRALANTDAILWKIEKADVAPSFLFGTMHLSDSRLTTLTPAVIAAIKQTKTVALEVADLSDGAMAQAMTKAADLIVYGNGDTLESKLTKAEYAAVQSIVQKSGMPSEFAGMFKPWLVNMLLALSDCERKKVAAGAQVLDMRIAEEAQKNGATVAGLETIEQQLSALASVPEDQQVQMLKVGLKYADRADDMIETLVQMYLKRQLGSAMPFQIALAAEQGVPASAFDGFKNALLVERNAKMRDAALPLVEKGSVFIAVGALHLSGTTGLVTLLQNAGYTLTAIE